MLISLCVIRVCDFGVIRRSRTQTHTHLRPTAAVDEDTTETIERSGSTKIRAGNLRHGDPQTAFSDTAENAATDAPAVVDYSKTPAKAEETYLRPDRDNSQPDYSGDDHGQGVAAEPPAVAPTDGVIMSPVDNRNTGIEYPQSETVGTKPGGAVQDGFAVESAAVVLAKPGITRYEA